MQLVIIIILAVIGVVSFVFPLIKKLHYGILKNNDRKEFETLADKFELADIQDDELVKKYETIFNAMQAYNETIYKNGQKNLTGELPENEILFDTSESLEIETFGYIFINGISQTRIRKKEIEKKELRYPIYLQANKANLTNGFATMPNTSLPIGGENTLSVLYGYAKENIIKNNKCVVNIGDEILLKNPYGELKYIVSDLGFITPEDTDYLKISEGESEIALLLFLPKKENRLCIYAKKRKKRKYEEYDD